MRTIEFSACRQIIYRNSCNAASNSGLKNMPELHNFNELIRQFASWNFRLIQFDVNLKYNYAELDSAMNKSPVDF